MEPQNLEFGGGATHTVLHPLVAAATLVTIALIFLLPRKYLIVPFLLNVLLVPFGQVLVLGGVHFTVYRIIVIFGLVRLVITKLPSATGRFVGGFNSIDRVFTLCALLSSIILSLRWMETQALIKSLGNLLDALGGYFILRFLIQDGEDMRRTIKVFALIAVVMAVCMMNERLRFQNIFGLLGGVGIVPAVRDGQIRAQGAFSVYVTAGAFGATLLPLFVWLWKSGESKTAVVLGIISSTIITVTSSTSTALVAYAAGIVALCLWPLRKHMRTFRWGLVITLVGLHLVMKAPVWALIARIDLTGSSAGYHRYMLVDNCIRHFGSWWLVGAKDYSTWGWEMGDLGNQYVECAETGGLLTLIAFIAIISRSFGKLGTARKQVEGDRKQEWFLWSLGAAVFANVIAYLAISYYDQVQVAWYALLAIISAAVCEAARSSAPQVHEALASSYQAEAAMSWDILETNP